MYPFGIVRVNEKSLRIEDDKDASNTDNGNEHRPDTDRLQGFKEHGQTPDLACSAFVVGPEAQVHLASALQNRTTSTSPKRRRGGKKSRHRRGNMGEIQEHQRRYDAHQ